MNAKNLIYAVAALTAASAMTSCSDNYLSTVPETSVSTNDVVSTVEASQLAMNGICRMMNTQWNGFDFNSVNGEAWINSCYSDAMGPDLHSGISMKQWAVQDVICGDTWTRDTRFYFSIPWKYCYAIIQQANTILDGIDDAEGEEEQRNFVKAQVLTLRAHGYIKLMMYYAPRWENSDNGNVIAAVLRTKGGTEDAPLCTMNDVFKIIYDDLNEAIDRYKSSDMKRQFKWQPDLSVAYGLFARAAMIKHDYATAQEMAHNASAGYSIMSNDTYLSGFYADNDEIMWGSSAEPADGYYSFWASLHGTNGIYTKNWGTGDAIDMDLYRQLDPNDIRRQCYLTPDKIDVLVAVNKAWNPGKLTEADWWNNTLVVESNNCNLNAGPYKADKSKPDMKYGLYNIAVWYSKYYSENIFKGDLTLMNNEGFMAYYATSNKSDDGPLIARGTYAKLYEIPFGAQYKFWGIAPYATGVYPYMRAAEMKTTEAEAAYYNGDETTARRCITDINKLRIPGYNCEDKSGDALLNEIKLCRRIELWGEGLSWTDYKRWNVDIVRNAWMEGDATSGNWQKEFGKNTPRSANHGWRMLIPSSEWQYNNAIDRNQLPSNID